MYFVPERVIKKYDLQNLNKNNILKGILLLAVRNLCFLHSTQPIKIAVWKSSHHIGAPYIRT